MLPWNSFSPVDQQCSAVDTDGTGTAIGAIGTGVDFTQPSHLQTATGVDGNFFAVAAVRGGIDDAGGLAHIVMAIDVDVAGFEQDAPGVAGTVRRAADLATIAEARLDRRDQMDETAAAGGVLLPDGFRGDGGRVALAIQRDIGSIDVDGGSIARARGVAIDEGAAAQGQVAAGTYIDRAGMAGTAGAALQGGTAIERDIAMTLQVDGAGLDIATGRGRNQGTFLQGYVAGCDTYCRGSQCGQLLCRDGGIVLSGNTTTTGDGEISIGQIEEDGSRLTTEARIGDNDAAGQAFAILAIKYPGPSACMWMVPALPRVLVTVCS